MYEWIIVGGGVQGCAVAAHLLLTNHVHPDEVLVIDPHEQPMASWKRITSRIGMTYLRSPSVHHLHPNPYDLKKYARVEDYRNGFKGLYQRPLLDMFNAHCDDLFQESELQHCWKQGTVEGLDQRLGGWNVTLSSQEECKAKRVVLAVGVNHKPSIPSWAAEVRERNPGQVKHVFDRDVETVSSPSVIIGGGMTAAHMAVTLAEKATATEPVTLIKRHPFRIHDFDSDPGWLGPKFLQGYDEVSCYKKRRALIQEARHKGSITKSLDVSLKALVRQGKLSIVTDAVEAAEQEGDTIHLRFQHHAPLNVRSILLATGAESGLPEASWLSKTIHDYGLPCAPCGFPVVDRQLKWSDGLYVAGALAELEIGPVSRNIAGARKSAERITEAFRMKEAHHAK